MSAKRMSPKQLAFIKEYVVDFNGSAAAERAGYSSKTARIIAAQLLSKINIQQAITELQTERSNRLGVTADRVIEELALVGFSDIGEIMDFSGSEIRLLPANRISQKARRSIASVKVKRHVETGIGPDGPIEIPVEVIEFKMVDKLSALDKLGRYLGLFVDREASGNGNANIQINIVERLVDTASNGHVIEHAPISIIETVVESSNGRNGHTHV